MLLLIMVAIIAVSTAACGLFGSNSDRLDTPKSITHTLNEETGENLVLSWMAVTNAQNYTVTIKKDSQTIQTDTVTAAQMQLDSTKYTKGESYSVTIVAAGEGYTDSKQGTYTFTYTFGSSGDNLTKLVMTALKYEKYTKVLSWTAVNGVRAQDSYEITIKDTNGEELMKTTTADTTLDLSSLELPESSNAGTASGIAKGDGATTADSNARSLTLNNDTKTPRMNAYKTWEAGFKAGVGTTLRETGFDPTVNEIDGVDIKDSETPGKSIITVFAKYTHSLKSYWGKVAYEIDKVEGANIQAQLNNISSKIAADNIVEDSKRFMVIGDKDIKLMADLARKNRQPFELKGYKELKADYVSPMTTSTNKENPLKTNYDVPFAVLADMDNQKWLFAVGNGYLETENKITLPYVCSDLSSSRGTITLESLDTYTGMAGHMALKEEYQAWVAAGN